MQTPVQELHLGGPCLVSDLYMNARHNCSTNLAVVLSTPQISQYYSVFSSLGAPFIEHTTPFASSPLQICFSGYEPLIHYLFGGVNQLTVQEVCPTQCGKCSNVISDGKHHYFHGNKGILKLNSGIQGDVNLKV